jgi:hypothetical protein
MSVFLTYPDHLGVAPAVIVKDGAEVPNPKAGEPEPLAAIGVALSVPTMAGGEVVDSSTVYTIKPAEKLAAGDLARIVPGTRTIEVASEIVENKLRSECGFIDGTPNPKPAAKAAKEQI